MIPAGGASRKGYFRKKTIYRMAGKAEISGLPQPILIA
jgi:hypothetical protein